MKIKKSVLVLSILLPFTSFAQAECNFTPDKEGFDVRFTGYGAEEKAYAVSNNTFRSYELASESGKLLGATIEIDATTVDTSADLNNGLGGEWPPSIPPLRSLNIVNGLFNNFANPGKIQGEIAAISPEAIDVAVTMNEVTQTIPMSYVVKDGVLSAEGQLDILAFDGAEAFKQFEAICTAVWHQGKSWTEVDISFSVPVAEVACQ